MDELSYVYASTAVIGVYFLAQVFTRKFDPFSPAWLFLNGFVQVYIVSAISYHEWAVNVRGQELVTAANFRAFWSLLWFLTVYHLPVGRAVAPALPRPPSGWSLPLVCVMAPPLIVWGLFCARMTMRDGVLNSGEASAEQAILGSFPFVMMVASTLLIVTGRSLTKPRPAFFAAGLAVGLLYIALWMFNGKRSHALMGLLTMICASYVTRLKRPSWPVLCATAFSGALLVALAIGWRGNDAYELSVAGFMQYLGDFKMEKILESLNVKDNEEVFEVTTYETTEYGGFLLMMDTVPHKSDYDLGANYLRTFSTFIPRIVWPSKPLFGRAQWVRAWIEGSEMDRGEDFTSPAIGILGATQLNGGAIGTFIVIGVIALALRTAYEFFRLHQEVPWVQFWWSIFFYNAWFMVVNDDPMVWFYYNWGFSAFPLVVFLWFANKFLARNAVNEEHEAGEEMAEESSASLVPDGFSYHY